MNHRALPLLFVLALAACSGNGQDQPATYQAARHDVIDPDDFKKGLATAPGTLVDVRTPDECAEGIIEGAMMIDHNAADFQQRMLALDKSKPVYLYCAAGGRSYRAAQFLLKNGFGHVVELNGGMDAWLEAGQIVVPPGNASKR